MYMCIFQNFSELQNLSCELFKKKFNGGDQPRGAARPQLWVFQISSPMELKLRCQFPVLHTSIAIGWMVVINLKFFIEQGKCVSCLVVLIPTWFQLNDGWQTCMMYSVGLRAQLNDFQINLRYCSEFIFIFIFALSGIICKFTDYIFLFPKSS